MRNLKDIFYNMRSKLNSNTEFLIISDNIIMIKFSDNLSIQLCYDPIYKNYTFQVWNSMNDYSNFNNDYFESNFGIKIKWDGETHLSSTLLILKEGQFVFNNITIDEKLLGKLLLSIEQFQTQSKLKLSTVLFNRDNLRIFIKNYDKNIYSKIKLVDYEDEYETQIIFSLRIEPDIIKYRFLNDFSTYFGIQDFNIQTTIKELHIYINK